MTVTVNVEQLPPKHSLPDPLPLAVAHVPARLSVCVPNSEKVLNKTVVPSELLHKSPARRTPGSFEIKPLNAVQAPFAGIVRPLAATSAPPKVTQKFFA
jgi:hypothetical protein